MGVSGKSPLALREEWAVMASEKRLPGGAGRWQNAGIGLFLTASGKPDRQKIREVLLQCRIG